MVTKTTRQYRVKLSIHPAKAAEPFEQMMKQELEQHYGGLHTIVRGNAGVEMLYILAQDELEILRYIIFDLKNEQVQPITPKNLIEKFFEIIANLTESVETIMYTVEEEFVITKKP